MTGRNCPPLVVFVMKKPSKELKGAADSSPQFLKARAVAARLNVSTKTVHRWAAAGHFGTHKLNARIVLFDLAEVMRFVAGARVGSAEAKA